MPTSSSTAVRELVIGPFAGGINTYSDPAKIADDELADCVNFDLTLDGTLESRPPWTLQHSGTLSPVAGVDPPSSRSMVTFTGTWSNRRFVTVTSEYEGSWSSYIYWFEGPLAGSLIELDIGEHRKVVRYQDTLYFIPNFGTPNTGFSYVLGAGGTTPIASLPEGTAAVIYKDRLWIAGQREAASNRSRLYFSDLANLASWPGSNFFDINPGDGDYLNEIAVYQDNLMLFKDSATYVLTYDSGPAQAVLQVVNTDVGAMGPYTVDAYENSLFIMKYNQIYEMSNYDFTRISVKVPFEYDPTLPSDMFVPSGEDWDTPMWLKVVGDRLVIRFYNRIYVYHLRLRAWTRWDSEDLNIRYVGRPLSIDNTVINERQGYTTYVACSSVTKQFDADGPGTSGSWTSYFKLFRFEDRYENVRLENGMITPDPVDIKLVALTKQYDIGVSHRFKRLMHWGVDVITGRTVTGSLLPFSLAYKVTWQQLHNTQWSELNTWDYPLFEIPSTSQIQPVGAGLARRYIRFPKSLRFRLCQFQIDMLTAGNSTDGPARLYSLTAFVSGKQLVPKAVN